MVYRSYGKRVRLATFERRKAAKEETETAEIRGPSAEEEAETRFFQYREEGKKEKARSQKNESQECRKVATRNVFSCVNKFHIRSASIPVFFHERSLIRE